MALLMQSLAACSVAAQVLLVAAIQHVVRDVAGARHDVVAVVHRLRDDDRHQAVSVGDLLRVARLHGRERRQKLALVVDEAKHVGHVAERKLLVECLFARFLILALGLAPVSFCVSLLYSRCVSLPCFSSRLNASHCVRSSAVSASSWAWTGCCRKGISIFASTSIFLSISTSSSEKCRCCRLSSR